MLPSRKLRIVVIDDNSDSADMFGWLLEADGHEVRIAYSGQVGLDISQAFDPQVIFCDLGMPTMSGYEFAEHLRLRDFDGQQPLLVTISGWGDEEARRRTHAAGFDFHLVKPANIGAVRDLLEIHIKTLAFDAD